MLVRSDGAGGTGEFVRWLTARRMTYSVGFTLPMDTAALYRLIPETVRTPAYYADTQRREGADVAELPTCSTSPTGREECG